MGGGRRVRRGSITLTVGGVQVRHSFQESQGRKKAMHDTFHHQRIMEDDKAACYDTYAVFGGKSGGDTERGERASLFCQRKLALAIGKELRSITMYTHKDKMEETLTTAFLLCNDMLFTSRGDDSMRDACTCATVLMQGRRVWSANVGDARTVLCRLGKAVELSVAHTTEVKEERQRVRLQGGSITHQSGQAEGARLVDGSLSVTRCFGYKASYKSVLEPRPHVAHREAEPGDEYIVLASGGLWTVMSPQAACTVVSRATSVEVASKNLVELALIRGCTANVTCCVIDLRPLFGIVTGDEQQAPSPSPSPKKRGSLVEKMLNMRRNSSVMGGTASGGRRSSLPLCFPQQMPEGVHRVMIAFSEEVVSRPTMHQGYLFKCPRTAQTPHQATWHKRWFVLKVVSTFGHPANTPPGDSVSPTMCYFGSEEECEKGAGKAKAMSKAVPLHRSYAAQTEKAWNEVELGHSAFSVQNGSNNEVWVLRAEGEAEAAGWVEAINRYHRILPPEVEPPYAHRWSCVVRVVCVG